MMWKNSSLAHGEETSLITHDSDREKEGKGSPKRDVRHEKDVQGSCAGQDPRRHETRVVKAEP